MYIPRTGFSTHGCVCRSDGEYKDGANGTCDYNSGNYNSGLHHFFRRPPPPSSDQLHSFFAPLCDNWLNFYRCLQLFLSWRFPCVITDQTFLQRFLTIFQLAHLCDNWLNLYRCPLPIFFSNIHLRQQHIHYWIFQATVRSLWCHYFINNSQNVLRIDHTDLWQDCELRSLLLLLLSTVSHQDISTLAIKTFFCPGDL